MSRRSITFRERRKSLNKYQLRQLAEQDWKPPDGGWGWLCVISCFTSFALSVGLSRAFGVIYYDILEAYPGAKNVDVTIIPSLIFLFVVGLGVVAGALSVAFSIRIVAFVGGFLAGLATSLIYFASTILEVQLSCFFAGIGAGLACNPGLMIVAKYFDKRRTQAVGYSLAGASFGSIFLPPALQFITDIYGFRGAFLITGGVLFNMCVGALVYRDPVPKHKLKIHSARLVSASQDESLAAYRERIERLYIMDELKSNKCFHWAERYLYVDLNLFYSTTFVITCISSMFFLIGYPIPVTFFPPHAISLGYSKYEGSLLLSISSIGDLIGRMLGFIFDKNIIGKRTGYEVSTSLICFSLIGVAFFKNYIAMAICVFFYGLCAGCAFILIPVILSENHGASSLPSSLGIVRSAMSIAVLISSLIGGFIVDVAGCFQPSMWTLAGIALLAPLVICYKPLKCNNRQTQSQNIV